MRKLLALLVLVPSVLSAELTPQGEPLLLATDPTAQEDLPRVVSDGDSGFLVVWRRRVGGENGIRGRRIGPAGEPVGGELEVLSPDETGLEDPGIDSLDLAPPEDGRFVVAWSGGPGYGRVGMRSFDPEDGMAEDIPGFINARNPDLARQKDGSFVVAWRSCCSYGGGSAIHGQIVRASGGRTPLSVDSHGGFQDSPSVASGGDRLIVVWDDAPRVFARPFDDSGWPLGERIFVSRLASPGGGRVAVDGRGRAIVTWLENDPLAPRFPMARRIYRTGTMSEPFWIDADHHPAGHSEIDADADGRFVVVWSTSTEPFSTLFGRTFDRLDRPRGPSLELAGSLAEASSFDVALDESRTVLVVWSAAGDVFARRFGADFGLDGGLQPPAAPRDLVATAPTGTSVELTWEDVSDDEEAFDVQIRHDFAATFETVATLPADSDRFEITDLRPPEGTFVLRVASRNAAGSSEWSDEAMVTLPGRCLPNTPTMCLDAERFEAEVEWRDFAGREGRGQVATIGSPDSGLFWFFHPDNWELMLKVLDGCRLNGHFWVFSAATTNVEYTLTVTDTESGESVEYFNPLGSAAAAITDTEAFAACEE